LSQCQNENETNAFREEAFAGPQNGRIQKYIGAQLEELQARFDHFQELKPCFVFLTNLCAVETKLTGSKKI